MNGVRTTLFLWCRKSSTSLAGMSQPLNGERLTSVSNGYFDQLLDEISCGLRIQQAPSFNHFSGPPPHSGAWASVISQALPHTVGPGLQSFLRPSPTQWGLGFSHFTGSNPRSQRACLAATYTCIVDWIFCVLLQMVMLYWVQCFSLTSLLVSSPMNEKHTCKNRTKTA